MNAHRQDHDAPHPDRHDDAVMKTAAHHGGEHSAGGHHYTRLGAMIVLMFLVMFALMYAMVDGFGHVYANLNQVYMAGLMTGAMVLIELALMGAMYPDKRRNAVIGAVSAVVLVACWFGIREQAAVGDHQFLRSMIPHHAGAILMCEEAPITDARIRALCADIITSQREEIAQMQQLLDGSSETLP